MIHSRLLFKSFINRRLAHKNFLTKCRAPQAIKKYFGVRPQNQSEGFFRTGCVLFAGGAAVFRSRNASPIQPSQMYELEGKTYVVTGGTSGIGLLHVTACTCTRLLALRPLSNMCWDATAGKSAAKQLVQSGAHVIVGGRDSKRRNAVAAELRSERGGAGKCDVLPLDLADPASVALFVSSVRNVLL